MKKDYTPFPPPQQPRKEDLQIESGEYFLSDEQKQSRWGPGACHNVPCCAA